MTALRRVHGAITVGAGLALAAAIYGAQRLAIMFLVIIVIALVVSLEALRVLANRKDRP